MGAKMMMSERPNKPRGIRRFRARNGCSGERFSVRRVLSNAVWDQDIADTSDGLDIKWELRVLLDFTAQAGYLHVDGTFELNLEPRAQIRARKRPAGIGGEQLQHLRFRAGQFY